ncbi:beta-1,3-glucan linked protein [Tritrichomonas musculus]|uniref:Beta-1,3-glucan linked protein n=1 Tax=Tritrichomonas musculus TaxID=1915356 RepID=A0ABR2GYB3_9EUKA
MDGNNKKLKNESKNTDFENKVNLLTNLNLLTEQIPNFPSFKFGKCFEKRSDLEHKFRSYLGDIEEEGKEVLFLFQNEQAEKAIAKKIAELLDLTKITIIRLLQTFDLSEKADIIRNFYQSTNLNEYRDFILQNIYPSVQDIPKKILPIIDMNKKESLGSDFFGDFAPKSNDEPINFEDATKITRPKNYFKNLDAQTVDEYDKFVPVVNLIIVLKELDEFKDEFSDSISSIIQQEKTLSTREMRNLDQHKVVIAKKYLSGDHSFFIEEYQKMIVENCRMKQEYEDEIQALKESVTGQEEKIQSLSEINKSNEDVIESLKEQIENLEKEIQKLNEEKESNAKKSSDEASTSSANSEDETKSLKEKIEALEKENNELKEKCESLAKNQLNEESTLNANNEDEIQRLKEENESNKDEIKELKEKIEDLEKENKRLNEKSGSPAKESALSSSNENEVQQLKERSGSLENKTQNTNEKSESIVSKSSNDESSSSALNDDEIKRLKDETQKLSDENKAYIEEIKKLKETIEKLKETEESSQPNMDEIQRLKEKEIQDLEKMKEQEIQDLKDAKEQEIKDIHKAKELEIQNLKELNERMIQDLNKDKEQEIQNIKEAKEQEIQNLKEVNEQEIQNLKDENEQKIQDQNRDKEQEIQNLKEANEKEIQNLKEASEQEIQNLKEINDANEQEIQKLKERIDTYEQEIESLKAKESNEQEMQNLECMNQKLAEENDKLKELIKQSEQDKPEVLDSEISNMKQQLVSLKEQKEALEKEVNDLHREKIDLVKDIDADCNDFMRCLKETHDKEKKFESLLQDRQNRLLRKAEIMTSNDEEGPNELVISTKQTEHLNFSEMSQKQREAFFDNLVNENKYSIESNDFCNLIHDFKSLNEVQFEYMLSYFKEKQAENDEGRKAIFMNLEMFTIPMIKKLYSIDGFSIEYLSKSVADKLLGRLILYEDVLEKMGDIIFLSDKLNDSDSNKIKRDSFLKHAKKDYYMICNSINKEVRIHKFSTEIESFMFSRSDIEKVFIPSSIISIQDNSFYQCKNLTTVSLDCVDLETIGKSAFSDCENLLSFIMPRKIKIIEEATFKGCKKLEKITFPDGLEEIRDKAFSGCSSLTEVKLPKTIQKVGYGTFNKCYSLKLVLIPNVLCIYSHDIDELQNDEGDTNSETVEVNSDEKFTIPSKCFRRCRELQNVVIYKKCQNIDDRAFEECSKLESLSFSLSDASEIGDFVFTNCQQLKIVRFIVEKGTSLEIGNSSFMNCKELDEIDFDHPELFTTGSFKLNSNVFSGCEALKAFNFPENSDNKIGDGCFEGCKKLKSVTLPVGLTKINKSLFKNCESLEKIELSDSIISIESNSFENCKKLGSILFPSNLEKIGDFAFSNCLSLSFQFFPPKIEEIGEKAFEKCIKFVQIEIPASMKVISKNAFKGCTELVEVVNNSSKLKIRSKAFYKCKKLVKFVTEERNNFSAEAFKDCGLGFDFFRPES